VTPQGWDGPLARFKAGEISPEIALTLLLLANSEADPAGGIARLAEADPALRSLAALATAQRDRITRVQALVASGIDPAEASVAATRAHFDRLAAEAPEAAVALYSFGDPDLLAAATAELVEAVASWTDLTGKCVLDFGCGIGRVSAALASLAGEVVGVDLSERMIAEARARASGLPNVSFESTDGAALPFPDGRFDLILAVDSYPYLVRAGGDVLPRHLDEAARLLRPGGDLIVFNWSYRGDLARDAVEARELGGAAGFRLVRAGEQPFRIWNGAGFQLVRE
jgi:SAM-dependent methyltransferase